MKETEVLEALQKEFADVETQWVDDLNGDNHLFVPAAKVLDVVTYLKEAPALAFDYLNNVSAFDVLESHIEVTYHLYSYEHRHSFVLKVKAPRENLTIPSISGLYGTALFQEREVYDHFGVKFSGHPDLRRILLPDDWVGHPLLKDYEEQEEYNGMGTTRPSMI